MTSELYTQLCGDATKAISRSELLSTLKAAEGLLAIVSNWDDVQTVQDIRANYQQMLDYLRSGVEDPHRSHLRHDFMRQLIVIIERACHTYDMQCGEDTMAETRRTLRRNYVADDVLSPLLTINQRFERVWTSGQWPESVLDGMLAYITSPDCTFEEGALIVSATMLSAQRYFDPHKLMLLALLCRGASHGIRVRAQLGLVLTIMVQAERLKYFPELVREIKELASDSEVRANFVHIQEVLLLAEDSLEVNRRMLAEMQSLPDMMAGHMAEEEAISKFTILKEMHGRGCDLNIVSFTLMARRLPFFDSAVNWFWPFSVNHPVLDGEPLPAMLQKLFTVAFPTDTDKYGFYLLTHDKPIKMQNQEGEPLDDAEIPPEALQNDNDDWRYHCFDLFRFYSLYRPAESLPNPFTGDTLMPNYEAFEPFFCSDEDLLALATWLMQGQRYNSARILLLPLHERYPDSLKVLRRLGKCSMELEDYPMALQYYQLALEQQPDSTELLIRSAQCLLLTGQFGEAMDIYYKLQYERVEDERIERGMAWGLLSLATQPGADAEERQGLPKAIAILQSLTAAPDVNSSDYVNLGHAMLLSGDMPAALLCYEQSLRMDEVDDAEAQAFLFAEDLDWLYRRGVDSNTMQLILDALTAHS